MRTAVSAIKMNATVAIHVPGDVREIDLAERPQLARLLGLRAAIDPIETALGLVVARIVVDESDRVDTPARRGLDLGNVVPQSSVAGEGDHRSIRARTFCTESGRKRPAEMAGAAQVALARAGKIVHSAHPHPGVTGIHDHNGI